MLINELHRYLKVIPKIIVTTSKKDLAYEAIQHGVADYILKPLLRIDFIKSILKLKNRSLTVPVVLAHPHVLEEKSTVVVQHATPAIEEALVLCIKSYGDHRYIDARDICYLQADNNSTDIHLNGGEMITAFKTLKHFEGVLSYPL
jgi:DNA-binding LytR/AlgR family response regulator